MANTSILTAEVGPRSRACNPLEPELKTTEDFSFHVWRQIFRTIVRKEKKAMDSGETVRVQFEVRQHDTNEPNSELVVKVEIVCEPGKPPRLVCDWRA